MNEKRWCCGVVWCGVVWWCNDLSFFACLSFLSYMLTPPTHFQPASNPLPTHFQPASNPTHFNSIQGTLKIIVRGGVGAVMGNTLYLLDTMATRSQLSSATKLGIFRSPVAFYSGVSFAVASQAVRDGSSVLGLVPMVGGLLLAYPLTVAQQNMQTGLHQNPQATLETIYRTRGTKALFAGFLPHTAWLMCSTLVGNMAEDMSQLPAPVSTFVGVGAAAATGAVLTPLDVIRTRLATGNGDPLKYGVLHNMGRIVQTEGFFSLYRGVVPRTIYSGVIFGAAAAVQMIARNPKLD
jgi:hypothetical protein